MLMEYGGLMTGTVKLSDGKFIYVPGRGAHKKDALAGYKIWRRLIKTVARETTEDALKKYLCARFHQNLVRWAQGKADQAKKSINQLKVSIGQNLDRKKGSRKPGYWEQRFNWLEKNIRQEAPQTPPDPPKPLGAID